MNCLLWLSSSALGAVAGLVMLVAPAPGDESNGCCGSGCGSSAISTEAQPATRPSKGDDYPLEMCPVMGVPIDSKGKPVVRQFDGRTVKLCCQRCAKAFEQDKEKYHAKMDEMIIETGKDAYPLETCVISGEKLGSMGEPVNHVHRPANRLVRFCCDGCVAAFKKEPAKFLTKIDEAAAGKEAH